MTRSVPVRIRWIATIVVSAALTVGALCAPTAATAMVYDTFEIRNFTWLNLTLATVTPPGSGWGPPPPPSVAMGEMRHFGVGRVTSAPATAAASYLATAPDGATFTVLISVDRGQSIDRSSCSTDSAVFGCVTVPSVNGSNTQFAIRPKHLEYQQVFPSLQPALWGQVLSMLCLRPSLATCQNNGIIGWNVSLTSDFVIFLYPVWSGVWPYFTGTRGNPYQQRVGTPPELKQFGFTTSVIGLPPGLKYDPKYDMILGWPSGMPGLTEVTVILKSGDTILTSGIRTITIQNPPK